MQDGLRSGNLFQIDVGVNKPRNLKEFLQSLAKYMEYEDDELTARAIDKAPAKKETQPQETWPKIDQGSHQQEPRRRGPRFTEHTPLNTYRSNIIDECANTNLPGIKPPWSHSLEEMEK